MMYQIVVQIEVEYVYASQGIHVAVGHVGDISISVALRLLLCNDGLLCHGWIAAVGVADIEIFDLIEDVVKAASGIGVAEFVAQCVTHANNGDPVVGVGKGEVIGIAYRKIGGVELPFAAGW